MQELMVNNKNSFLAPADELQLKYNENSLSLSIIPLLTSKKVTTSLPTNLNNSDDWNILGQQRTS